MAMDIGSAMFELGGGNPVSDTPHASVAARYHGGIANQGRNEPQGPSIAEMESELRALVAKLESVMSRQPANAQMADQMRREAEALKTRINYLKEMIARADAKAQEAAQNQQQLGMGMSGTRGMGGHNRPRLVTPDSGTNKMPFFRGNQG